MKAFWIGLGALGLATVAGACRSGNTIAPGECGSMCGKGTRCDNGTCVVDYGQDICGGSVDIPDVDVTEDRKPPIDNWAECTEDMGSLPEFVPVDDSDITQFDPNAARSLDMNAGEEQLDEEVINNHMREIEYTLNECFSRAACYNEGAFPTGELSFTFRLEASGEVSSVAITAPEEFNIFGTIPCSRRAVGDHKFPSFDGAGMTISYSVELL